MELSKESRDMLDIVEARSPGLGNKMFDAVEARRIARQNLVPTPPDDRLESTDMSLPSLDGTFQIPARLYRRTDRTSPVPLLVYFHGGGWVLGDLETHDALCGRFALQAGVIVLAVAYRLAPEARYPTALDDAYAAVRWAEAHGKEIGAMEGKLAVAGDSSGGNVAAAVALRARDAGSQAIGAQILIYPPLDSSCESPSYGELPTGGGTITLSQMQWFWEQYIHDADEDDPLISPIRAELEGLPPALIVVAGYDPLRDDGRRYADLLATAKVPVQLDEYPETFHGFLGFEALQDSQRALRRIAEWITRWRDG